MNTEKGLEQDTMNTEKGLEHIAEPFRKLFTCENGQVRRRPGTMACLSCAGYNHEYYHVMDGLNHTALTKTYECDACYEKTKHFIEEHPQIRWDFSEVKRVRNPNYVREM